MVIARLDSAAAFSEPDYAVSVGGARTYVFLQDPVVLTGEQVGSVLMTVCCLTMMSIST